jgi:SAM-dependent methyltransferase
LAGIQVLQQDADAYFLQHRERYIRTLSFVPPGHAASRALELGSYMHMSAALQRVLGYGHVFGAYYSSQRGRETKSLSIAGEPPFLCDIDLFDVETHAFPYADEAFDLILCCEVIEHLIRDPMHMLFECARTLTDNGLLLLTTPNVASLTSVACALQGWSNPQVFSRYPASGNSETPHVREYTPRELADTVQAAGFKIESIFTERLPEFGNTAWVRQLLRDNGFDVSLRGEQMYCLARKRAGAARERYPDFLYAT